MPARNLVIGPTLTRDCLTAIEHPKRASTLIATDCTTLREFIELEAPRLEYAQLPCSPLVHVLKNGLIDVDGLWMEFGVYQGTTINAIARYTENTVYGFDSFSGLPEDWREGKPKGRYNMQGRTPPVRPNVQLIEGWFDVTLPQFLDDHPENAAFVHIDCDIYSSAKTVLSLLRHRLVSGTILIFDEMFNYPGFQDHEIKAFYEFLKETRVACEWLGMKGLLSLDPDATFEAEYYARHSGTGVRIL